jgi:type II secretory pathway component PulF
MTSLEELIAFNDEVASLTRAGVPIDLGLSQLSRDPDIANSQINAAVTRRVQNGVSLVDAMAEEDPLFPPIYQSVVRAGLRCGRLPTALEELSRYTQASLDVRQNLRSALVYPLIVCLLAYALFVAACLFLVPQYDHLFTDMGSDGGAVFHVVRMLSDSLPFWVAIPPALLIALLYVWFRSNSSRTMLFRGLPKRLSWFPGVSRIAADQHRASFAELLALLVENEVPLLEGLPLAARACGSRKLTCAAQQMAAAAEQGQSLTQDSQAAKQFPPFLRWALTSSTEAASLARTLRLAAKTYRHRAERRAEWLRIVMPMLTCVVLAGGVTLLYCLSVFAPVFRLIQDLS